MNKFFESTPKATCCNCDRNESDSSLAERMAETIARHLEYCDDINLTRKVIEALGKRMNLPVIVGDSDPVRNAKFLEFKYLEAFKEAGADESKRLKLVRDLVGTIDEMKDVILRWDREMRVE